ncbi:MAG: hypothetical protein XXXJIFNMEKO3_01924 [Candidatus Erwinia impunctatus]|nr:hypothetical protein XXXJIFNMEKO_01924 [Culicoides impunctatus]
MDLDNDYSPWRLGATLYIPATHKDLAGILFHQKIPALRSLVVCLEDAINDEDIPQALRKVQSLLNELAIQAIIRENSPRPLVFIRPRHPEMAKWLVDNSDLSGVDGFVLPKFTLESLPLWWKTISETKLCLMPTLETNEVFDVSKMNALAKMLATHPCRPRIIALRTGGNDLMNLLSLRRPRQMTLYDSPLGYVVKMLVATFAPYHFSLTAPVCEHIDDRKTLNDELTLDIAHGLVGKTAIHPTQIPMIEQALRVSAAEHSDALRILNSTQAVFKSQGAMCEPATHRRWATAILERVRVYGLHTEQSEVVFPVSRSQ